MSAAVQISAVDHALEPLRALTSIAPDARLAAALCEFAARAARLSGAELAVVRAAAIDDMAELRPELSAITREQMIDAALSYDTRAPTSDTDPWPEPIELPGPPGVPEWNDALLPDALRPWLSDVAERMQCPPEYTAVGAIVALGAALGRGCAIRPKRHDPWTVVPNLWGAVVGPPSALKTPALRETMQPLRGLAANESERHNAQDFEREEISAQCAVLKNKLKDVASKGGDTYELRTRYDELQAKAVAANAERRFIVNDSSVEKLGELLAASPRGVMLFRDELTGWLASLDRAGHESERAFYLEAWDGNGEFVYDRIGRGTVRIEAACVSILGGIQPGPLGVYLRDAVAGGAGADGLMQRFQLVVYPDQPKTWSNVDRRPNSAAREQATALYEQLVPQPGSSFRVC